MNSRVWVQFVVVVLLLCGVARPALADGIPLPSDGELITFLIISLVVLALGCWVFIRLAMAVARKLVPKSAQPTDPPLPTARIHDGARK